MGLFLTLLSLVLCYFSPGDIMPELAPYHVQQIVLLPAMAISFAVMSMRRIAVPYPQGFLIMGLWFAVVMSVTSKLWWRASFDVFMLFGLMVILYFLVYINTYTLGRVRALLAVLILCGLVMSVQVIFAYHFAFNSKLVLEKVEEGVILYKRVHGLGILDDPNDFAQFLVLTFAALGVFWSKRNPIKNLICVFVPGAVLTYAIYLTFSRGAMFGLVTAVAVGLSRKVGKFGSAIAVVVMFAVMMLAQFGGGREMSVNEGSAAGRVQAWGTGIALLRANPLFGVGYGEFTEFNDLTAHNSFVLCFAELGLFGYFFWMAMLVTTIFGLQRVIRLPVKVPEDEAYLQHVNTVRAMLFSFLATAWFLSRTYTITLYIVLGVAAQLVQMRKETEPRVATPFARWGPVTVAAQLASFVVLYITVRMRSL